MTDEQLKALEQQYLKELDNDLDGEQKMVEMAKEIAGRLLLGRGKTTMELFGSVYVVSYTHNSNKIVIIFVDPIKYNIANGKYRPYTVTYEIENNLSMSENLSCACEAFLRHEAGKDSVSELE